MRWRRCSYFASAWLLAAPIVATAAEDNPLQYQYLKIYLQINTADQLEKQGNYAGALADFKDCYARLQKIHNRDPDWESALVIQRMNDCRSKIIELESYLAQNPAAAQPPAPPAGAPSGTAPSVAPAAATTDVDALKQQLANTQQELSETKAKLQNTLLEETTLRTQLASVSDELKTLKASKGSEGSDTDQVGKLLTENKALTEKLTAAQKEIAAIKSPNPRSALSMLRAQLKNSQDQLAASEAANAGLQQTTATLTQQLNDAQADLRAANDKLASAPTNTPEYQTLKRENEVMREILTRELQEQAHRDMAKRLAQEEFDRLRITSKVLQEQLDILGSPMTPPSTDQERALLDSLRVPSAQVASVPTEGPGNSFAAGPGGPMPGGNGNSPGSAQNGNASTPTNNPVPAATPPLTNQALTTANQSVAGTTPNPPNAVTPAGSPPVPSTNPTDIGPSAAVAPASTETNTTTAAAPPATNATSAPSNAVTTSNPPSTPADTNATTTATPPATNTVATTGTPSDNSSGNGSTTPPAQGGSEWSQKPRLPDDMRDTAQQAADLFKMQRYDDASAKYQEIIDKYPDSLYAWSNLGVVRFQQGKLPEALKALQRAVSLSPTDAFSYENLGIVYYQMGQYENAISALERALALDPQNAKSHNYLGCACSQKGWSEVAEKEFLKAIELDDTFGDAHFNLALVYATEKPPSLEMARRHYKRALELGIAPDPRLEKLLQMDGSGNSQATADR